MEKPMPEEEEVAMIATEQTLSFGEGTLEPLPSDSSYGEDDAPPIPSPPSLGVGPVTLPQDENDQKGKERKPSSYFFATNSGRRWLLLLTSVTLAFIVIAATVTMMLVRGDGLTESSSTTNIGNAASLRASTAPSPAPSTAPSEPPTVAPSSSPSTTPTVSASDVPSLSPTNAPTDDIIVEPNPVPSNAAGSYFNYDTTDSDYGPDVWDDVDTSDNYLVEFGPNGYGPFKGHLTRDPSKNRCGREGKMSPVDLYQTDIAESKCDANHQIRTREGKVPLSSEEMIKRIEPHKLSLVMNRRSCVDFDFEKEEPKCLDHPPRADYPR